MTWSKDLIENITDIGELEAKLRFDRRLTQQMRALCEKFPGCPSQDTICHLLTGATRTTQSAE